MHPLPTKHRIQKTPTRQAQPRVTVIMATYNAMPYLESAVQSILDQTYADFRMLIVDDGSTDESKSYLDSITDPRVEVLTQANQGQQAASNAALARCQSEFIARMDADDVAAPNRLEKQIEFLDSNPDVGVLGSQFRYLGSLKSGVSSELPCEHEQIFDDLINNRHSVCNTTTMVRAELFSTVGQFWEHNISEDWDWFLRAGEKTKLANLPDALLDVRIHSGSINARRMVESQLYNEYAAELCRLRQSGQDKISFEEFTANHRTSGWPNSMLFRLDCYAIGQYRSAVANILSGQKTLGFARLAWSMACSPARTLRRIGRVINYRAR